MRSSQFGCTFCSIFFHGFIFRIFQEHCHDCSNFFHFRFFKSTGCYGSSPKTDSRSDKWAFGIKWNGIFVCCNTDFIKYMLSDDVQGSLVKKTGYISTKGMKVERDADGNVTKL